MFPSPQDIQGQWKNEYSFKFSGVVDLQSIPKLMKKKCLGLKNPVEFTCMNRAYCDNNVDWIRNEALEMW